MLGGDQHVSYSQTICDMLIPVVMANKLAFVCHYYYTETILFVRIPKPIRIFQNVL